MQSSSIEVRPDWGHPLQTPEGGEIRVPKWAFPKLRKLGLLVRNRAELSPRIYQFLNPQLDTLTEGLRILLGPGASGPEWVVCKCRECMRKKEDVDHMPVPFSMVGR